jgi:hypothetical protein
MPERTTLISGAVAAPLVAQPLTLKLELGLISRFRE